MVKGWFLLGKEQESGRGGFENKIFLAEEFFSMLRAFLSALFSGLNPRASHFCYTAVFYVELTTKHIFKQKLSHNQDVLIGYGALIKAINTY